MGNAGISRHAVSQTLQADPRSYFQTDLPNFIVQKRIGNGKFTKTYLVHVDGIVRLIIVLFNTLFHFFSLILLSLFMYLIATCSKSIYETARRRSTNSSS